MGRAIKSIVLGFCKCKKCGKDQFIWNSYFICRECGCKEYENSGIKNGFLFDDLSGGDENNVE